MAHKKMRTNAKMLSILELHAACKKVRYGSAAGWNGVPPWLLAQSILDSPGDRLGKLLIVEANKFSRALLPTSIASYFATALAIGLNKTAPGPDGQADIRPLAIASAWRRIMCKAFAMTVKDKFRMSVSDHQAGVHKGGYEAAVHGMRQLTIELEIEGKKCLVIIDFANAFNAAYRPLLLACVDALIPELSGLCYSMYADPCEVITKDGDFFSCEDGTQQGDPLSNIMFGSLMAVINAELANECGLGLGSLYYWDDSYLWGTPATVGQALARLKQIQPITGLAVKPEKCSAHSPSSAPDTHAELRRVLRRVAPEMLDNERVHNSFNTHILKQPIGDDAFVASEHATCALPKATKLCATVSELAYNYPHEALALMQNCLGVSKAGHIASTGIPSQVDEFFRQYDRALVAGGADILNDTALRNKAAATPWVEPLVWRRARMLPSSGGLGIRTGKVAHAARYV